jgi:hypothetical protein
MTRPIVRAADAASVAERSYRILQETLASMGFASDGAPWEQLSPRERAIWTARCRATLFLVGEAMSRQQDERDRAALLVDGYEEVGEAPLNSPGVSKAGGRRSGTPR